MSLDTTRRLDTAERNRLRAAIINAHKKTGNLTRHAAIKATPPAWRRRKGKQASRG